MLRCFIFCITSCKILVKLTVNTESRWKVKITWALTVKLCTCVRLIKSDNTRDVYMNKISEKKERQGLSGRVLDSRPRGRGFQPNRRHCFVSLSKTHLSLLSMGSTQEERERSGSVVECLTRDRRAAGSSLTGVTALWSLWSLSKTHLS